MVPMCLRTWNVSSCRRALVVSKPLSRMISWDLAFSGPSPIVGSSAYTIEEGVNEIYVVRRMPKKVRTSVADPDNFCPDP